MYWDGMGWDGLAGFVEVRFEGWIRRVGEGCLVEGNLHTLLQSANISSAAPAPADGGRGGGRGEGGRKYIYSMARLPRMPLVTDPSPSLS